MDVPCPGDRTDRFSQPHSKAPAFHCCTCLGGAGERQALNRGFEAGASETWKRTMGFTSVSYGAARGNEAVSHCEPNTDTQAASALWEHSHQAYREQWHTCLTRIWETPSPQLPPSPPFQTLLSSPLSTSDITGSHSERKPEVSSNVLTGCTHRIENQRSELGWTWFYN